MFIEVSLGGQLRDDVVVPVVVKKLVGTNECRVRYPLEHLELRHHQINATIVLDDVAFLDAFNGALHGVPFGGHFIHFAIAAWTDVLIKIKVVFDIFDL